ncbi:hypothetical protein SAMN05660297_01711 [Natronincola peptidivorans]|uniref:Uncharacterized protein n=1 Tax=Natronincola peptidivorans TaxID=426128 RepID=A0A1I0CRH9_9FIRM|nr:hypothetical protein [Natronincola peptidivorans]SET21856.1 hypothetical protein SAMN05660297_01711 [Natronincola peptidivorans]
MIRKLTKKNLAISCFVIYMIVILSLHLYNSNNIALLNSNTGESRNIEIDDFQNKELLLNIERYYESDEIVVIKGWALLEGISSSNTKTYLTLTNDDNNYVFPVFIEERKDVTKHLGHEANYDDSGFQIIIDKQELSEGMYDLKLKIETKEISLNKVVFVKSRNQDI